MIPGVLVRHGYAITVAALGATILGVGGLLANAAMPELVGPSPTASPAEATPSPVPRSSMGLSAIAIEIPADADCAACHVTASGDVGTKPIPAIPHPLWGWRDCTACHADDRLVATAPGHSSLHKADCLVCHKVADAAATAVPRPHHVYPGQACTECHGTKAPLPVDMQGRTNCWLCHTSTEYKDLFASPAPGVSPNPDP